MDTKQVQCFLAIAECKNFTEAAIRLYISQPAVSRHIFNLEKELGLTLFKRDKRSVEMTPAGAVIHAGLLRLSEDFSAVIKEAERVQKNSVSTLRVGIVPYISYHTLPPTVYQFFSNSESQTVDLESYDYPDLGAGLRNGKYDIIITFSKTLQGQEGIEYKPITHYPVQALCAKTLIEGREHLGIKALNNMDFFVPDPNVFPGAEEDIGELCRSNGISYRSINVVPNSTTLAIMCTAGHGAILLHEAACGLLDLGVEDLAAFHTPLVHELVVAYRKACRNPAVWTLVKLLDDLSAE